MMRLELDNSTLVSVILIAILLIKIGLMLVILLFLDMKFLELLLPKEKMFITSKLETLLVMVSSEIIVAAVNLVILDMINFAQMFHQINSLHSMDSEVSLIHSKDQLNGHSLFLILSLLRFVLLFFVLVSPFLPLLRDMEVLEKNVLL